MNWSDEEIRGAKLRRSEAQLVRMALAAFESGQGSKSGLFSLLRTYISELVTRPRDCAQIIEALAYTAALAYIPERANAWAGTRSQPAEQDAVRMVIMWAVDALDRPEGSPDRELPVQAIRTQAAGVVNGSYAFDFTEDLVLAVAFVSDYDKLQSLMEAKERWAHERLGGNRITWMAGSTS